MAFMRRIACGAGGGMAGIFACFAFNQYKSHQDLKNQKVTELASKRINEIHSVTGKETLSKLPTFDADLDQQLKDRSSHVSAYFVSSMCAIVGGPSSGKTTIIKKLEERGELVVHEAAADLIKSKIEAGVLEPWKEKSLALDIFKLQLEREEPYLSRNSRVFIDRGVFDAYAFAMDYGLAGTPMLVYLNGVLNRIDLNQRYKAVFFIEPHGTDSTHLQTEVRRENAQEAAKQAVALYAIYCKHDNFFVVPGGLSAQECTDFILEKIRQIDKAVSDYEMLSRR